MAVESEGLSVGGSIRNALTVDVEDYFHVSAFADRIRPDDWPSMEYRAEANTEKLLEIFSEVEVKATFFVLGWVARRSPKLIRKIRSLGHEVASHGLSHQLVYAQAREEFERETRESKHLIEDTIGECVKGYRAASWSITRASLWALDVIAGLGFAYDSSIFPVRHDRYGIPGASPRPGLLRTPGGAELLEFPPSTVGVLGLRVPVAGGGYFRLLPYVVTRSALRRLNSLAEPFIFYLHPWEIDPDQPRVYAGWLSRFRHYTNLAETERRLRRLLHDFRFTTAAAVLEDLGLLGAAADKVPVAGVDARDARAS